MTLLQVFLGSVYSLASIAGILLAVCEGSLFPAGLTPLAAAIGYWSTEKRRGFRLNAIATNILAVTAMTAAGVEFVQPRQDSKLLAIAHLTVYLSWVVLLKEKQLTSYWWVCALSVLQVAIGSVLTISPLYGMLLMVFLALGLWTLYVFSLYRLALRFAPAMVGVELPQSFPPSVPNSPLAGMLAIGRSESYDSVQQESPDVWLNLRSIATVAQISLQGLLLGLVLFLLIPRLWQGASNPLAMRGIPAASKLIGFTDKVQLGQIGKMLQNNSRVMQVWLYDDARGEQIEPEVFAHRCGIAEPLFRGVVLENYTDGLWQTSPLATGDITTIPNVPRGNVPVMRQEIELQPIGGNALFAMRHISGGVIREPPRQERIQYHRQSGALSWSRPSGLRPIKYIIFSEPADAEPVRDYAQMPMSLSKQDRLRYLQLPSKGLERLQALAREVADAPGANVPLDATADYARALTVEGYLRDKSLYKYSLDADVDDPAIDPVEDFLFNRKKGHCEYFASALALMLRSVGVPTRVVNGFKGGRFDSVSGALEVQQRHAHSWVEAFVEKIRVDPEGGPPVREYQWIVLDSTPASDDDEYSSAISQAGLLESGMNLVANFWSNYIVSLNIEQQRQSFYDPLQRSAQNAEFSSRSVWAAYAQAKNWLYSLATTPRLWFTWQGAATALGLVGSVGLGAWLLRRLFQATSVVRRAVMALRRPKRQRVDFYDRYLSVVGSAGCRPSPCDTPLEFARSVQQQLDIDLRNAGFAALPDRIAKAYYRVRFGEEALDRNEMQELRSSVDELERKLLRGNQALTLAVNRWFGQVLRR